MWISVVATVMMSPQTHTFVCPECHRSIEVDYEVRKTLLDVGCIVCGAPVTEDDITDPRTT